MIDMINRLQAAYDKVSFAPEQSPTGWIDLIELRNVVGETLIQLRTMQRKAEDQSQVKGLVDELEKGATMLHALSGAVTRSGWDENDFRLPHEVRKVAMMGPDAILDQCAAMRKIARAALESR